MEEDPQRAVLQPRNPGESLKVAETVLKRRERNLKAASEKAAAIACREMRGKSTRKTASCRSFALSASSKIAETGSKIDAG